MSTHLWTEQRMHVYVRDGIVYCKTDIANPIRDVPLVVLLSKPQLAKCIDLVKELQQSQLYHPFPLIELYAGNTVSMVPLEDKRLVDKVRPFLHDTESLLWYRLSPTFSVTYDLLDLNSDVSCAILPHPLSFQLGDLLHPCGIYLRYTDGDLRLEFVARYEDDDTILTYHGFTSLPASVLEEWLSLYDQWEANLQATDIAIHQVGIEQ